MALSVEKCARESKVKDFSLSDVGRLELKKAELKMPVQMACRTKFGPSQPFKGAKITVSLNMTAQTGVLVETLTALGAEVRCCSSSIFSTVDHVAAAIARDSATVFAWQGQTLQEYWSCMARALDWGPSGGPHLILDHCGDLYLLIYEGTKAEKEFASTGKVPDQASTDDVASKSMLAIISESLKSDPMKYHKLHDRIVGATMETSTGAEMLLQMQLSGILLFPAISVSESVIKSKFANYGCQSLPDDLMNATNVMIAGKVALVAGYGDTGRGCAAALKQAGARVIVTEIDPVCALQATMKGIQVLPLKDAVSEADIFVTTTGYKDMIMVDDMRKMKNDAILCNIGSFVIQTDMAGLETFPGVKKISISPIADRWVFSDIGRAIIVLAEGRPMNLSCPTGPPSFELWNVKSSGKYDKKVYEFPKHLDDKVAALHLEKLGEDQADHICVQVEVDYQPANDMYGAGLWLKVCALVISCLTLIFAIVKFGVGFVGDRI